MSTFLSKLDQVVNTAAAAAAGRSVRHPLERHPFGYPLSCSKESPGMYRGGGEGVGLQGYRVGASSADPQF